LINRKSEGRRSMTDSIELRSGSVRTRAMDGLLSWFAAHYRRSEGLRGYTLLFPTLLLMVLSLAAPFVYLLALSFWSQDLLSIDTTATLANYQTFFEKESQQNLLWRSIKISAIVTALTVLAAYPLAYFIAFYVKKNKFFWIIMITIPFWTSYMLRVFAWKVILGYNGVVNSGLKSLGLIEQPLEFLLYNQFAVVLTLAHAWAAFAILPIYVSLEKLDRSLLEAATILGDGPLMRFLRVTLPLSLPGVIAASLMVFIPTVGDYVTPALIGGPKGIMIGNLIQLQFGASNNWPLGAALSIISLVAVAAVVLVFLWCTKLVRTQEL
jgi:spermidine/putrescine transport system permease protein